MVAVGVDRRSPVIGEPRAGVFDGLAPTTIIAAGDRLLNVQVKEERLVEKVRHQGLEPRTR